MKNPYAELLLRLRGKQTAAAPNEGGISQQNQQVDQRAPLQYLSDHPQMAVITEVMRRLQAIDDRLARIEQALGAARRADASGFAPW